MSFWDKGELNDEQEEAVLENGNVFLVACPGSGKTRALTYKIAYELSKQNSKNKWVVAITYTHRAADEIQDRIENMGVDTSKLWIGTIHSFCLEWVLRPYSIYHENLKDGFKILNSHDSEVLITALCRKVRGVKVTYWDCGFYYTSGGRVLTTNKRQLMPVVSSVLDDYNELLKEDEYIDFEQMLLFAFEILNSNPNICRILGSLFSHVLVDEYQDTKEIQYAILSLIIDAGEGRVKSFVVGDPNQAIYGTLGGYAITLGELSSRTGQIFEEKFLSYNYRSSERIVNYFKFYNVYESPVSAEGQQKDYPSIITYENNVSLDGLVDRISELVHWNVKEKGVDPREICILAPQWFPLASTTRKLVAKLPEYDFDGPGMVPFARDIDNFWYKVAKIILTVPSPKMYVRRLRWAREILQILSDIGVDFADMTNKSFLKCCNSIDIEEKDGLRYLKCFFDTLLDKLDIDLDRFLYLKEHYESFFASSQVRIDRLKNEGLEYISGIEAFRKVFESTRGITVSTIHGVKGGEFDVVIAYGLLQGMVPNFNDQSDDSAKKLLYVVASRARKNLHLISEAERYYGWKKQNEYQPTNVLAGYRYQYD